MQALPMDANGDGRRDLIVPTNSGHWAWLYYDGSDFLFDDLDLYGGGNVPADGANGDAWTGDVNGDGLEDLIWAVRAANLDQGAPQYHDGR
jgi:hypothetical protein